MKSNKKPFFAAFICLAIIHIVIAQHQIFAIQAPQSNRFSSWREVTPEGNLFRIRFPREPRYERQDQGRSTILHKLTATGRNATFGIVYYSLSPGQAGEFHTRYRNHDPASTQRQMGSRLVSQRTLTVGNFPALELVTEVPRYGYTRTLTVASDTHFYILTAWGTRVERLRSAEVDHFFNSFNLAAAR
jgi:hypothetical protein